MLRCISKKRQKLKLFNPIQFLQFSNEINFFRAEFYNNKTGKYFRQGDIIKRPEYAETLRKIGESGSSNIFYKGEMGKAIVQELADLGGIMTIEDLEKYE